MTTETDDLVKRLENAQGGMHSHCRGEVERYKCERGTCACYERHIDLLAEAHDTIERLQQRIAVLEKVLRGCRDDLAWMHDYNGSMNEACCLERIAVIDAAIS